MGKGGYHGGSTTIRPNSGWFSDADPRTERLHAVGKMEGEAARLRIERLAAEKSAKIASENAKKAKADKRQRTKAAARKEQLLSNKADEPASVQLSQSEIKQRQKMEGVLVVKKKSRTRTPKKT